MTLSDRIMLDKYDRKSWEPKRVRQARMRARALASLIMSVLIPKSV